MNTRAKFQGGPLDGQMKVLEGEPAIYEVQELSISKTQTRPLNEAPVCPNSVEYERGDIQADGTVIYRALYPKTPSPFMTAHLVASIEEAIRDGRVIVIHPDDDKKVVMVAHEMRYDVGYPETKQYALRKGAFSDDRESDG